jgi:hypothetical protein
MAPPAPRECNQPARSVLHRNHFAAHRPALRIPCIAAHYIANNPRTVQRIASQPARNTSARASHPVQRSAPRECNQPARSVLHRNHFAAHRPALRIPCIAAHYIANNPRTVQRIASQPARNTSARASHPVQRSAPRECNQPARSVLHRNHFAAHRPALRIPCIAAHYIANNPRTVQRIASQPARNTSARASHPVQRSAPRECNQPAHRKQSAHRQPARHASPAAPAAHHPPHGAHLTPAALHALRSTLRWFRLVRGTNFNLYTSNCKFVMCS